MHHSCLGFWITLKIENAERFIFNFLFFKCLIHFFQCRCRIQWIFTHTRWVLQDGFFVRFWFLYFLWRHEKWISWLQYGFVVQIEIYYFCFLLGKIIQNLLICCKIYRPRICILTKCKFELRLFSIIFLFFKLNVENWFFRWRFIIFFRFRLWVRFVLRLIFCGKIDSWCFEFKFR